MESSVNLVLYIAIKSKNTVLSKQRDWLLVTSLPWLGCKLCVLKRVTDWWTAPINGNSERIPAWPGPKSQQRQRMHRPVVGAVRTLTVSCCSITTQSWGCFSLKHASMRDALRSPFNPMVCFTRVNMTEPIVPRVWRFLNGRLRHNHKDL